MLINQYHGVNSQLNDWLVTTPNCWEEFHGFFIHHLAIQMNQDLKRRGTGYVARTRPGLQIRRVEDDDEGSQSVSRPEPDVGIYRQPALDEKRTRRITQAIALQNGPKIEEISLEDSLGADKSRLKSIGIFAEERPGTPGKPVAWIEILSPTNKPGVAGMPGWGRHADAYKKKRIDDVLSAGQVLVEVDLLQAQPLVYEGFPRYQRGSGGEPPEPGSVPFSIAVSDPQRRLGDAKTRMRRYPFRVEDSLPKDVLIPLLGNDTFHFDFDTSYDQTIYDMYGDEINYAQYPALWSAYSTEDQKRIAARTATVLRGMKRGLINSQQVEPLPLDVSPERALSSLEDELSLIRGNGRPGFEIER